QGMKSAEKQEALHRKGVNWNDYPDHFKRGTYFLRQVKTQRLNASPDLPEKHEANTSPEGYVEIVRTKVLRKELPPANKIANYPGVLFNDEEAEVWE
ncbi:MAG: hypothetical protein F6K62_17560, partial [Sphaerospermopsis sp. SIO1G2]|nr:hypothetical protein [Sphaerospermopsis sp. SIO1G2]